MPAVTLEPRILQELIELGSATVYEAAGQTGAVLEEFTPLDPAIAVAGPARCVKCPPGDNLAIHRAVAEAEPGDVLVVDVDGFRRAGHWGEVLTAAAQARGIAGLVINGSVRDARPIVGRRFPVFHQGLCIRAATKWAPAAPRVDEVVLGDCPIRHGDLVLADQDGIAVVPKDRVREVLEASRERVRKEQVLMEGLGEGKTTLELLGLS